MLRRKMKKQNPAVSCLVTLLSIAGVLLVCFLLCTVVFQLNQSASASSGGGLFGFWF